MRRTPSFVKALRPFLPPSSLTSVPMSSSVLLGVSASPVRCMSTCRSAGVRPASSNMAISRSAGVALPSCSLVLPSSSTGPAGGVGFILSCRSEIWLTSPSMCFDQASRCCSNPAASMRRPLRTAACLESSAAFIFCTASVWLARSLSSLTWSVWRVVSIAVPFSPTVPILEPIAGGGTVLGGTSGGSCWGGGDAGLLPGAGGGVCVPLAPGAPGGPSGAVPWGAGVPLGLGVGPNRPVGRFAGASGGSSSIPGVGPCGAWCLGICCAICMPRSLSGPSGSCCMARSTSSRLALGSALWMASIISAGVCKMRPAESWPTPLSERSLAASAKACMTFSWFRPLTPATSSWAPPNVANCIDCRAAS